MGYSAGEITYDRRETPAVAAAFRGRSVLAKCRDESTPKRQSWNSMMDEKKFFTVEEANRLIPHVKGIVEELRRGRRRLLSHRSTAEAMAQKAGGNGGGAEAVAYLTDYSQEFRHGLAQLEVMGIVLKDLERGLIDFPHWRDGREVYLCWEYSEDRIDFWHETDSGYSGRQPL